MNLSLRRPWAVPFGAYFGKKMSPLSDKVRRGIATIEALY